jgi:hypothetical protein
MGKEHTQTHVQHQKQQQQHSPTKHASPPAKLPSRHDLTSFGKRKKRRQMRQRMRAPPPSPVLRALDTKVSSHLAELESIGFLLSPSAPPSLAQPTGSPPSPPPPSLDPLVSQLEDLDL